MLKYYKNNDNKFIALYSMYFVNKFYDFVTIFSSTSPMTHRILEYFMRHIKFMNQY